MDGSNASVLIAEEISSVDTYDTIALEFANSSELPSGVEGEIVEQLKSLGYLDGE